MKSPFNPADLFNRDEETVHNNENIVLKGNEFTLIGSAPKNYPRKHSLPEGRTKFITIEDAEITPSQLSRGSVGFWRDKTSGSVKVMNMGSNNVFVWSTHNGKYREYPLSSGKEVPDKIWSQIGPNYSVEIITADNTVIRLGNLFEESNGNYGFTLEVNPSVSLRHLREGKSYSKAADLASNEMAERAKDRYREILRSVITRDEVYESKALSTILTHDAKFVGGGSVQITEAHRKEFEDAVNNGSITLRTIGENILKIPTAVDIRGVKAVYEDIGLNPSKDRVLGVIAYVTKGSMNQRNEITPQDLKNLVNDYPQPRQFEEKCLSLLHLLELRYGAEKSGEYILIVKQIGNILYGERSKIRDQALLLYNSALKSRNMNKG